MIPPVTSPLSQSYIGYGVINVSYTRVTGFPEEDNGGGASPGYLRRGAVVRLLERRMVKTDGKTEAWVFAEGSSSGWLKESLLDIYANEQQAKTASEFMGR